MTAIGLRRLAPARPADLARTARTRLATVVDLLGWSALTVVGCLLCWIAGTAVAFGWRPVVLDGQSMAPAMQRGDVAMIESVDAGRDLDPGTVATFRSASGDLVTHRIASTDADGAYVTRGDANGTEDVVRVDPGDVVGVGRLVVPSVGLPLLWLRSGDLLPVGVLAGSALLFGSSQVARQRDRRRRRST